MSTKDIVEFFELLSKLPEDVQTKILYITEGAALVNENRKNA